MASGNLSFRMSETPSNGPITWLSEPAFKWASNFGVAAVGMFFLLWIVYKILFDSLTVLSQDIEKTSTKENVNEVSETIKEGFAVAGDKAEKTNELLEGICRGIHRTEEDQEKYCYPTK